MRYPTLIEVELANHEQICEWWRFLESPGMSAIDLGREEFKIVGEKELAIMTRIGERLKEFGGFTPKISKSIGWIKR